MLQKQDISQIADIFLSMLSTESCVGKYLLMTPLNYFDVSPQQRFVNVYYCTMMRAPTFIVRLSVALAGFKYYLMGNSM